MYRDIYNNTNKIEPYTKETGQIYLLMLTGYASWSVIKSLTKSDVELEYLEHLAQAFIYVYYSIGYQEALYEPNTYDEVWKDATPHLADISKLIYDRLYAWDDDEVNPTDIFSEVIYVLRKWVNGLAGTELLSVGEESLH